MPTLTVQSHPRHLADVRQFVRGIAAEAQFDKDLTFHIVLAVDEACANIIRHAYGGDYGRDIIIEADVTPDAVEFRLRDFGKQVDPAKMKSRNLDDIRPGGLGCHLIRKTFDTVEYTHLDVGTQLRLVKRRVSAIQPGTKP
ncbi:MAG: ATP-binding protein [Verrucomicrobiae bacterium]|nr:ATP-binding protein [Verrucomicrobiae bacterium]